MARNIRLFMADFETTVYDNQTETEVWAAAIVELFTPNEYESVKVVNSLELFLDYIFSLKSHCRIWFHNLKFDGSFIVDSLMRKGYKPIFNRKDKEIGSYEFKILVSDMQRWYSLKLRKNGKIIEFRDSAKLAPLSVKECGIAYKTKFQKTSIEYKGFRKAGGIITPQEDIYIKNDVLVMKEVLELFVEEKHDRLTIGSCCVEEYKNIFKDWAMGDDSLWDKFFPDLKAQTNFDNDYFLANSAFEFVYRFYHGAWCYKKEGVRKVDDYGLILDKVSMYPSHMDSLVHDNKYGIGFCIFFKGKLPDWLYNNPKYVYMVRFKCKFKLKEKHYPMVQIKNSFLYDSVKWRETSDFDIKDKSLERAVKKGKIIEAKPVLHLAEPDFILFMDSYEIWDVEWMGGCYFQAVHGIFDDYIEKYRKRKEVHKGGKRTIDKLFSNNLYGKLATNDNSSYLVPYLDPEKDCIEFDIVREHNKPTLAIQSGLLVTAYGRCDIIRFANSVYERFLYSDTDSLHLLGKDIPEGVAVSGSTYGTYKVEGRFRRGIYLRQKTYAEQIIEETKSGLCGEKVDEVWEWNLTCAGMPDRCKENFKKEFDVWESFHEGTRVEGKFVPKRIKGGTILKETDFTIHEK